MSSQLKIVFGCVGFLVYTVVCLAVTGKGRATGRLGRACIKSSLSLQG